MNYVYILLCVITAIVYSSILVIGANNILWAIYNDNRKLKFILNHYQVDKHILSHKWKHLSIKGVRNYSYFYCKNCKQEICIDFSNFYGGGYYNKFEVIILSVNGFEIKRLSKLNCSEYILEKILN